MKIYSWNSRSANDKNNKPHGFIWWTICTSKGNFRILPVGYVFKDKWVAF